MLPEDIKINHDAITDLQTLIRQPSVSAKNQGLVECANLVSQIMRNAGIETKPLYISNNNNSIKREGNNDDVPSPSAATPTLLPPIVYGEVISKSNPNGNGTKIHLVGALKATISLDVDQQMTKAN